MVPLLFRFGRRAPISILILRTSADVSGVGSGPRRGINPGFQAQAVNLIAKAFHVREVCVALDGVERAAPSALPRIVNIDAGPAVIDQAGLDHGPRALQNFLRRDLVAPAVPTVPPH